MIVIDLLAAFFVIVLILVGVPALVRKYWLSDPKHRELEAADEIDERGETNALRFDLANARNCAYCQKATDPYSDLRVEGGWVHVNCYKARNNELQRK